MVCSDGDADATRAQHVLEQPMKLFILTGAGISAESGLGRFRDKDGLWTKYDPMTLATPRAFARDPTLVHEF